MNSFIESLTDLMSGLNPMLVVFIISLFPILELRGGLIAAALLGVPIQYAFPICLLGTMLPIPFILLFIRKILDWMKKFKRLGKIVVWVENKADRKSSSLNKYRLLGLFIFVAVPLPGTGAWTGALVANTVDIRFKHSLPIIFAGTIVAGIIVSSLSYGLLNWIISLF